MRFTCIRRRFLEYSAARPLGSACLQSDTLRAPLAAGLAELGLRRDEAVIAPLLDFLAELETWNRAYNLTAVRDPAEMLTRHLLDSAAVAPWVRGERVLDVGSGAGFPGLVLAILERGRQVTVLDSNGKKVRFLRQVRRRLGLGNVEVVQARVEDYRATPYATIVSRAFAEPASFLAAVHHLVAAGGRVLAMLGRGEGPARVPGFRLAEQVRLRVPGLNAERNLYIYQPWPESSR